MGEMTINTPKPTNALNYFVESENRLRGDDVDDLFFVDS
jgi:hypothetical protein